MLDSESAEAKGKWKFYTLAIGGLLCGVLMTGWTIMDWLGTSSPPAMTPEQFRATFQAADAMDRANYEKMMREAGKSPPKR